MALDHVNDSLHQDGELAPVLAHLNLEGIDLPHYRAILYTFMPNLASLAWIYWMVAKYLQNLQSLIDVDTHVRIVQR